MMEIVHDLAPGAQLFFSGPSTSTDMVNSINYLKAQGCNVIVDDISFFGEGYFQDTSVAQAAESAVNSGVVYVTSAGNLGSQEHWQGIFAGNQPGYTGGTSRLLNFSGLNTPNNAITIPSGSTCIINLQWSDPFGASANDYNLYLADNFFSLVKQSTFVQNGNDNPFEQIVYTNSGATATFYINVEKNTGAANREVEMTVYGNSSMQYSTSSDELTGQEAVQSVMVVAAENAGSSSVASYSSRGGSTIYTDFVNQVSTVRQTLDGTAIDGVQTAIGPVWGHQPFYGTSAAAPHAAAIAALLRQVNPSLTPAQVVQFMADTATDFTAYGVGYDTTSGAGLYNALDAAYKAYTPGQTDLTALSDTGVSNTDNITNDTTPTFTGSVPAGSYVTLYVDGVANQTVQLGAGVSTYNLTTTVLSNGTHAITIKAASSNSVLASNFSNASTALNVKIDTLAPTMLVPVYDPNQANMTVKVGFSEDVSGSLSNATLKLLDTHSNLLLPGVDQALSYNAVTNIASFTFTPGFPSKGILPDSAYQATFAAASITDLAGNHPAADQSTNFFFFQADANFDRTVNALDFNAIATNFGQPNKHYVDGDFNYDGAVNTLDFAILASKFGQTLPQPIQPLASVVIPDSKPLGSLFNDNVKVGPLQRITDPLLGDPSTYF
jgi:hypothetical protein